MLPRRGSHERRRHRALAAGAATAVLALALGTGAARADQVVADDLLVQGSGCIGVDCVNGEAFGDDTLRVKENNLRIRFEDTSAPGLPRRVWQLKANDSASGGRSYLAVADLADGAAGFSPAPGADAGPAGGAVLAVALADVDGDGLADLVVGRYGTTNLLYLNNGDADPFAGVAPTEIGAQADLTTSILAADFNGDGLPDVVAGNYGQPNRIYLNNGTADPFAGVAGTNVSDDGDFTTSLAPYVIGFGDPSRPHLLAGNFGERNRYYPNNGTADPFAGVLGVDATADEGFTTSLAAQGQFANLVVAGNYGQPNRLYATGSNPADPFAGVVGVDVTADADFTTAVALGDVNGDALADVVAGNEAQPVRLYLNDGASFAGAVGTDLTAPGSLTTAVVLAAVGIERQRLDLVVANDGLPNLVFSNGGGTPPFGAGVEITGDADRTTAVAVGDVNGDSFPDLVAGNWHQPSRLYLNAWSTPVRVVSGAPGGSLHVGSSGSVGVGTTTPDPAAVLDVAGTVRVRGDLELSSGARTGVVPARAFRNGRARVVFERPLAADYVIALSPVARGRAQRFRPTVLRHGPDGFVFAHGGRQRGLREVHWTTRIVGER